MSTLPVNLGEGVEVMDVEALPRIEVAAAGGVPERAPVFGEGAYPDLPASRWRHPRLAVLEMARLKHHISHVFRR